MSRHRMIKGFRKQAVLLGSVLWFTTLLPAQVGESPDYSAFSLDELFNIDVVTASKQEEPQWEAPGVVSVITAAEIEAFGARNLGEILERMPSMVHQFTFGVNRSSVRGGDPAGTTLHILMLLDGRPLRTTNGNFSFYNVFYTFPLELIERIEFIRGPGSVLYGTNAFEGVINIITKEDNDYLSTVALGAGSFNTEKASLFFQYDNSFIDLEIGMKYTDTEGWPLDFEGPGNIDYSQFDTGAFQDDIGIHVNLNYENFSLSYFSGDDNQWSETFFTPEMSLNMQWDVTQIDLSYEHTLSQKWRITYSITKNNEDFTFFQFDDTVGNSPSQVALTWVSDDILYEATTYGRLGQKVNLLFGFVYQSLSGDTGEIGETLYGSPTDFKTSAFSGYAQFDYKPNRFFKFIAGAQYNWLEGADIDLSLGDACNQVDTAEGADSDVVPRVASIINFSPNIGIKALWGEAFRSPTGLERGICTPGFQKGNPNLGPEKIQTSDFQIFSKTEYSELVATYYHSTEKDLIRLDPSMEYLIGEYKNTGRFKLSGFEFEAKFRPTPNWYFSGSFLHQSSEDENGLSTIVPETSVKFGVSFTNKTVSVSLFNSHFDSFSETISEIDPITGQPDPRFVNPPPNSFNSASMNASVALDRLANLNQEWQFDIYVTNLFDEEIWVPESVLGLINTIPGYGERAFYGTLKARF